MRKKRNPHQGSKNNSQSSPRQPAPSQKITTLPAQSFRHQNRLWFFAGVITGVTVTLLLVLVLDTINVFPLRIITVIASTPTPVPTLGTITSSPTIAATVISSPALSVTASPSSPGKQPLPVPYTAYSGKVVLNHTLTKDAQGWDTSDSCTWDVSHNVYHVKTQGSNDIQCGARIDPLTHLVFQIRMTFLTDQSCGGLFIQEVGSPFLSYKDFSICADGTFTIGNRGVLYNPLRSGSDQTIKKGTGQENVIGIVAEDNHLILFINGAQIDTENNVDMNAGAIGVEAVYTGTSSEMVFHDAQVWQI